MNDSEQKAVLLICILAAFADGAQSEVERAQIKKILDGFANSNLDLAGAYQEVLACKVTLADAAGQLTTPSSKMLAYEMAVCVCNADGTVTDAEQQFLANLHHMLELETQATTAIRSSAQAMASEPLQPIHPSIDTSQREAELDHMILNYAILNGALEIMPHSLATMAIVPLQMRMVYRVGKSYGYELGRGHVKDFLATVGIGLTSQVFEGFARRLFGGLARPLAGRLVGGLLGQAAGSAFGFASTYALGQAAKRYYASGRTLTTEQLKDVFRSMLDEARSVQSNYSGEMAQKAREVKPTEILTLVKQN